MSVDRSLNDSSDLSRDESIPMERLKQFVEDDLWYFSDDDSSGSSDEDISVGSSEGSLQDDVSFLPEEGPWIDLCRSCVSGHDSPSKAPSSSSGTATTTSPLDESMGLQSVINHFLAKLQPYNAAYDDEESTDSGSKRSSDTQLLLVADQAGERQENGRDNEDLTGQGGGNTVQLQEKAVEVELKEEKDHSKPLPSVETVPSKRPKYFFIANEILTSERTFVQGIRLLEKVLHGALKTAHGTGKPMIPESLRKRIFLNISEIHSLNADFLEELETRIQSWNVNTTVCDTLASRAPYFKLYSMYAAQLGDSQAAYEEALKKYKPFLELTQHIESSNLCKGLPLTSYMLYPIQRIPRYKLLLQDYLKNIPENHSDKKNTEKALQTISEVAQHLNDRIRDLEEQATIVKLQKLFTGKENLVIPGRRFILRGPVELVSGKKLNRRKTRVIFLFSDVLLLTKVARNIKFKILKKFLLSEIQVSSMYSHSDVNDFCIFQPSVAKPFRLCARDRRERDIWVNYLRKSIALELDRRKSFESIKANYMISLKDTNNKRSLHSIISHDPSFESRQPKCARKTFHPRRRMIVNPAEGGIEDTDGGVEEVDGGDGNELMFEMEVVVRDDHNEDELAIRPGFDNTLSTYMRYKKEGAGSEGAESVEMWFVLTYTALTGYCNHRFDKACWAMTLAGCRMIIPKNSPCTLKLVSREGSVHVLQLTNEYDYDRWRRTLQEILNFDINKI